MGGGFDPSQAFNVDLITDSEGEQTPLSVTFDNPPRPTSRILLDNKKLIELRDLYIKLHNK